MPSAMHYSRARMKGYGQFCPVAKAAEIVAERWTPLVLRELLCGSRRFNDLHRGVPLMSRTLLAGRLERLEDAGIVRSATRARGRGREYHLTAAGEELRPLIECLGEWGQRWARAQVGRGDLDPGLLMWDIHRRVNLEALPPERVVVRFDFRGVPATVRCPRSKPCSRKGARGDVVARRATSPWTVPRANRRTPTWRSFPCRTR